AGGDPVRPGDHPQRGALAAARGAEQDHELAVGDVEVEAVDGGDLAVPLSHPSEGHARHGAQPTRRTHRGETGAATGACAPPGGAARAPDVPSGTRRQAAPARLSSRQAHRGECEVGGDQAAAKTLFGRSSLDGGTADAPCFTAVVVASFAAGAGVGLLASGGPRGSTAATIAFATVVALAAVWSAVANAREAQASVGRDLVAAERARLGRELHST